MASLDPQSWPMPSASMLQLSPAGEGRGDTFLDRETMAAFIEGVHNGTFGLDEDWAPALSAADDAKLETEFLERLRGSRLGPASPVLHHRRLALFEAVKALGTPGTIPGFGLSVHNISRCIGDVETWVEGQRQEMLGRGMQDEEVFRMLLMIPSTQLAALLHVSEPTLSRMRTQNMGPRYAKLTSRTHVYPLIAVLEWLNELVAR